MSRRAATSILYKFRHFNNDNNVKTLSENKFYFATPSELNDPFDMSLRFYFEGLTVQNIRDYYYDAIDKGLFGNPSFTRRKNRKIVYERSIDKDKFIEDYQNYFKDAMNDCSILALSKEWKRVLLWSHYSDSFKGFCIGLNKEKLRKFLPSEEYLDCSVSYGKNYLKINPFTNILDISSYEIALTYKFKDWKYEKEVRFIKLPYKTLGSQTIILPDDFIEEVILGFNCRPIHECYVKCLLAKKSYKPKLYKLKQKDFSFELGREEIFY